MKLVIVEEGKGVDTEPTLYLRSRVDSDGGLTIEASTDQTFESNVERVGYFTMTTAGLEFNRFVELKNLGGLISLDEQGRIAID